MGEVRYRRWDEFLCGMRQEGPLPDHWSLANLSLTLTVAPLPRPSHFIHILCRNTELLAACLTALREQLLQYIKKWDRRKREGFGPAASGEPHLFPDKPSGLFTSIIRSQLKALERYSPVKVVPEAEGGEGGGSEAGDDDVDDAEEGDGGEEEEGEEEQGGEEEGEEEEGGEQEEGEE